MTSPIGPTTLPYYAYRSDPPQTANRQTNPVTNKAIPDIAEAEKKSPIGPNQCKT